MAINMFTKPAEFKYVELPFEAIAAAGAARQKRYDEGDKLTSDINDTFLKIGSRKLDTPRKQELVNEYQQQIYDVVDNYSGDLGAALPKIKELQRKINYDMAYGELGAINSDYKKEQESIAEIQKLNEEYIKTGGKSGISGEEAQALLNYEMNELNNSPVRKNPDGTWSSYQKYQRMPTINVYEEAREIGKLMKPETIEQLTGLRAIGGGFYQHGKETKKYLEAEAIQMAVEQTMRNDPRFTSYLAWRNEITGKNKAVRGYLDQNMVTTPEGIQYLPGKDNQTMVNPMAWADEVLHSHFTNAAADAGRLLRQSEITRDVDYMHVAPREPKVQENPYAVRPLNTPNVPLATALNTLQKVVGGLGSNNYTVKLTKEEAYGPDGKLRPGVTAKELNVPANTTKFGPRNPNKPREYEYTQKVTTYDELVTSLNNVDRARMDYVIQNGSLKGKKPSTAAEWKVLENDLNTIGATAQYSGIVNAYEDVNTRRKEGEMYNANMQNFMFFDETGELTSALPDNLKNSSRVYSGTELRQAGIKISELTGKMTTSSAAPRAISGPGGSYTFAAPDIVLMKTADGREITGLVGRNKAQIDGGFIAEVLESSIKSSSATGLPEALFTGSDYVVTPVPNSPYNFKINRYGKKGEVIESIDVKAENPVQLRESVINIWNDPSNGNIRNELQNNLFR
jgi:hypothetical protein